MPPPYTGTTTLLEYLVDILEAEPTVVLHVVNTLGIRGKGLAGVWRFADLMWRACTLARQSDVVTVHCSTTGLHVIGMAMYLVSLATRRPLIVRKFAGDDYQSTLGPIGRRVAEFVLRRCALYLAESHLLVDAALARGIKRVAWYPNSRPIPAEAPVLKSGPCRKFVYIGRIIEGKGMAVLAAASRNLPPELSIDLYGPWGDDLPKNLFDDCPNICWHGPLKPEAIIPTFQTYDASLLPTYYRGEGYPGAVLESYLAGVPVIATRWRAVPEIVDDSVGILIAPQSAEELAQAMIRIAEDAPLYRELCAHTREKAAFFGADRWAANFLDRCREVV